jgi:DNA-binding transcriptional regulator LsrR (DeoR family)
VAEKLYKQGFTQEQIATQLGVGQSTIDRDLANLPIVGKLKSAKTASNARSAEYGLTVDA